MCIRDSAYTRHDEKHLLSKTEVSNFNPRAYTRHDYPINLPTVWITYFNPRAYTRHDDSSAEHYLYGTISISIHVPTRGTTCRI